MAVYISPLVLLATAMFLGSSLIANAHGLVQPALREDLGLSPTLAGTPFSVYSLCIAAGSWGAGRVAGRIAGSTLLRSGLMLSFGGHAAMLATPALVAALDGWRAPAERVSSTGPGNGETT